MVHLYVVGYALKTINKISIKFTDNDFRYPALHWCHNTAAVQKPFSNSEQSVVTEICDKGPAKHTRKLSLSLNNLKHKADQECITIKNLGMLPDVMFLQVLPILCLL